MTRSEADLLDIRNFGQKSIDEVKLKLAAMGLALKDSPAGFGGGGVETFGSDYDETYGGQFSGSGLSSGTPEGQAAAPADDTDYAETEEL